MLPSSVRRYLLAAFTTAALIAGCSSDTVSDGAPAFVSDAAVLGGTEPEIRPSALLDYGEVTIVELQDGAQVRIEVAFKDLDGVPIDYVVDEPFDELDDGTDVAVEEPTEPGEGRFLNFTGPDGAYVGLFAFDVSADRLLALANDLRVENDGSLTVASERATVTGRARLPLYSGGAITDYLIDDGELGSVTITSFVRRGDELAVFDFGPHDPATVDERDLLYYDYGGRGGSGSYVFAWDDDVLIEVNVFLAPGVATEEQIAEIIETVRPVES